MSDLSSVRMKILFALQSFVVSRTLMIINEQGNKSVKGHCWVVSILNLG